jgi:ABC-type transport system involved in cytochrome c biogenesis permease subunit
MRPGKYLADLAAWLTLGLALGCVWGQVAWGNWWGWDIKETWALISWITLLLYFLVLLTIVWTQPDLGLGAGVMLGSLAVLGWIVTRISRKGHEQ